MRFLAKFIVLTMVIYFYSNAATIKVAAGGSVDDAIKNSVANDTLLLAADSFTVKAITISHALTIIGAGRDSTFIVRSDRDSLPTMTIKAKRVHLSKMWITGHNGFKLGDEIDSMFDWHPSDAIVISDAESVSVSSCVCLGGKPVEDRSLIGASGATGIRIIKSSQITLTNDSLHAGNGLMSGILKYDTLWSEENPTDYTLNPWKLVGKSGSGLRIDTSTNVKVVHCVIKGGQRIGMDTPYGGFHVGDEGTKLFHSRQISIDTSILIGGIGYQMLNDTFSVLGAYDSSSVALNGDSLKCNQNYLVLYDAFSTILINGVDVKQIAVRQIHLGNVADKNNQFSMSYINNGKLSRSLHITCNLSKSSLVRMDVLNAQGQIIKRIHNKQVYAGQYQYALNLSNVKGLTLSSSMYFLRISTSDNQKLFRLFATK